MGIRNLREINDIDIIVTSELWSSLSVKYGIDDTGQFRKIVFPGGLIEVFGEWVSFHTNEQDQLAPTIADRIAKADIIEGLPFESLEHMLYFKRKMGREKDLKDILIIETWLEQNR